MKIIVDGNLIDTEFIYKISDVYAAQYHSNVSEYKGNATFVGNAFNISYAFRIDFINNKHIDVSFYENYMDKRSGSVDFEWYESERKTVYNKVEKLKNQVEEVWLDNQTIIPKFNFDK